MTLRKWALAERNEIESQICKGWVEGKGQLMQLAPLSASPLRFMFCCIGSRQTLRASNTSLRHAKVLLGQRTQRWELASPLKPRAPGTRTMAYLSYDYEVFGKVSADPGAVEACITKETGQVGIFHGALIHLAIR